MRAALPALLVALAVAPASAQVPTDSTASQSTVESLRSTVDSLRADGARSAIPPTPRRVTTVPLPNGEGVFYYRAGTPGGVRLRSPRSQPEPPAPPTVPVAPSSSLTSTAPIIIEREGQVAPTTGGLSRLDLALLEERLLRAIDQRLAALDPGYRPSQVVPSSPNQPPIIVLPAAPGAPPAAPLAPPAPSPTPEAPPPAPAAPSPAPAAPPAPPADPLVAEIERAILDTGLFRTSRVNFEFGKATLLPVSEASLRAVAAVLRRYPELRVEVGGHTDWISSEAYNLRLSQQRAESVRDFLIGSGVAAGQLTAVGYGENRPVASNETETGRALNRRVEFTVLNPEAAERERRTIREAEPNDDIRQIIRDELERLRNEDGQ